MYNFSDTSDFPFASRTYFCILVTIGSYFTLNLILAQIMDTYIKQDQARRELQRVRKIREELIEQGLIYVHKMEAEGKTAH